ncbi:HNH endonuclease [Tenacibaculum amylolyticum]|uniref:HNH endonuclease n=1 Tax=Tenacibaculum amylolyticum TaxID=104269 RepID=UPI0038950E8B
MKDFLVTKDGKYLDYSLIKTNQDLGGQDSSYGTKFNPENFNLIFFDGSGRLATIGQYMAINEAISEEFKGYIKIDDFFKAKASKKRNSNTISNAQTHTEIIRNFNAIPLINLSDVHQPKAGDKINLAKRYIAFEDGKYIVKTQVKSFLYPEYPNENYKNIESKLPENILFKNINESFPGYEQKNYKTDIVDINVGTISNPDYKSYLSNYFTSVNTKKFKRANGESTSLSASERNVIEQIMMIYNKLFSSEEFVTVLNENNVLRSLFIKHFEIINDINFTVLNQKIYHNYFTKEYFYILLQRLREFYYSSFIAGIKAGNPLASTDSNLYGYIIGLFGPKTMQYLDYKEDKIQLFKEFLQGNWFITGRWNPTLPTIKLTEEEVLITMIESIPVYDINGNITNIEEVNKFMNLLANKPFYERPLKGATVFEDLYKDIDPDVVFGGAGARGRFADAVYRMWLASKYNPKNKATQTIYEYTYTPEDAQWKFYDDAQENKIDKGAAPRVLPYESEKKLFWYYDNMQFEFDEDKIRADKKVIETFYGGNVSHNRSTYKPHGYYHIFQPINLINASVDTFVKVPFDRSVLTDNNLNTITPCDIEQEGRGSNLPIFYAKYIDDIGDKKDNEETIMLLVDVVSIVTGGWGIARRLLTEGAKIAVKKAFKSVAEGGFTSAAIAAAKAELLATVPNLLSVLKTVAVPTIELLLGTASLVHKIATGGCTDYHNCNNEPPTQGQPGFKKYQRCQAIEKWLFALEMLTLSGDFIAKKFFRKSTAELNDVLPDPTTNSNPFDDVEGFTADDYSKVYENISSFNELGEAFTRFLQRMEADYPKIAEKLRDFTSAQQQAFLLDFENVGGDVLEKLNDATIMERWQKLFDVKAIDRTRVDEVLTNTQQYNNTVKFYELDNLADALNELEYARRKEFFDSFVDQSDEWLAKLSEKPEAIGKWSRMTADMKLVAKNEPEMWLYIIADLPEGTKLKRNSVNSKLTGPDGTVYYNMPEIGPPPKINFKTLIKFKKLSPDEQSTYLEQAYSRFTANASGNAYTDDPLRVFEGVEIPRTRGGEGISPDFENTGLRWQQPTPPYKLGDKLLSENELKKLNLELTEPLDDIIEKINNVNGQITAQITGLKDRKDDFANSWIAIGVNSKDGEKILRKLKLTWHHVDDLDTNMSCTMQLVRRLPHQDISHSGAVKQMEWLYDIINDLP